MSEIVDEILLDAEDRMEKAVEVIRSELVKVRTGKANPVLLQDIKVDYYGTVVPLKQLANVGAPEARLLVIHPWDRNSIEAIEKAVLKSDLGLNPMSDGNIIRIPIPSLTEERRKDLVKYIKKMAEDGRIAIRNVRRDANDQIKKKQKAGTIPEDEANKATDEVQKATDKYIEAINKILEKKEEEIMEV